MKQLIKNRQDVALLALRLALGVVFVLHGYAKLNGGMTGFTGMVEKLGFPLPVVFAYVAAFSELLGGIALLLGIFTSVFTPLLMIVMLVVLVGLKKFAFPKSDLEFSLFLMAFAVYLAGPGRYSLAAYLKRGKKDAAPAAGPAMMSTK